MLLRLYRRPENALIARRQERRKDGEMRRLSSVVVEDGVGGAEGEGGEQQVGQ